MMSVVQCWLFPTLFTPWLDRDYHLPPPLSPPLSRLPPSPPGSPFSSFGNYDTDTVCLPGHSNRGGGD